MKNLKVTAMVAGALVGGLVLGGVGIAAATTVGQATPGTTPAVYASAETTYPVSPPSGDTTVVVTPPSGATTESATPTCTPRPGMPAQAKGHAYGRMIAHPNRGLHLGWRHTASAKQMVRHMTKHMNVTKSSAGRNSHGGSVHVGGSMMGR